MKKREMLLSPYNPDWVRQFETIKLDLVNLLSKQIVAVHHFGSTAVEGMSAKPIIDVLVTVKKIEKVDSFNKQLEQLGYIAKGENGISERRYFEKYASDNSTHLVHLHFYQDGNYKALEELKFRDFLRNNQEAFDRYLEIKREASQLYRYFPEQYQNHKSAVIKELIEKANTPLQTKQ
ncbi:GrpB family protein [Streptococcus zalophi]|uniref:GrpB family protein n=1 Tax=Streptococcus zalophi TaxID=640031 RepID=UPI00215C9794|nr:GrpB family protein [Streptococcus zalophi]MCR8967488.1 GrpB family protein [Streptococcus zalophi]